MTGQNDTRYEDDEYRESRILGYFAVFCVLLLCACVIGVVVMFIDLLEWRAGQ